jgi:hypothetical protein
VTRCTGRRLGGLALLIGLLAVVGGSAHAPVARADADPASDTLLVQDVFYPYSPSTPPALQTALGTALKEIHADGLNLDVAIIHSPIDLGGIPEIFGHVSQYARFLDVEISYRGPQPLLVVMPDGTAVEDVAPATALRGLRVDSTDGSAGLARTAIEAVEKIAAANGHPIAAPSLGGGSGGGGGVVPIAIVAVLLLLTAAWLAGRALRGRRASTQAPGVNIS